MRRRAVFLDRDGTINREQSFVTDVAQLALLPDVVPALHRLKSAGFALVVVTNQSGIARGLYTETTLARIHETLHGWLHALPDGYFHCPHHPDETGPYARVCTCRKPGTGLIESAAELLDLALEGSFVVGDSARDVLAGLTLPVRTVLVQSGKPWREQLASAEEREYAPDHVARDLPDAVDWILR